MNKKIIKHLIFVLFFIIIFIPNINGYNYNDELDQYNLQFDGWGLSWDDGDNCLLVQSFSPNLNYLTKVELLLKNKGNSSGNLKISIRNEREGADLTYSFISADIISFNEAGEWILIDFPDLNLESGKKYYIVFDHPDYIWSENKTILWGFGYNTSYLNGEGWYYDDNLGWLDDAYGDVIDFCFKTYGYGGNEEEPNIVINEITGSFGVKVEILNNGTAPAYNVTLSIDVVPASPFSIVISGSHMEELISELGVNEKVDIQSNGLWGIGSITITVKADEASKSATAFLLGPLVLRVT